MKKIRVAKVYAKIVLNSVFKNKIQCFYQNSFRKNIYKVHFKNRLFRVIFKNFTLEFKRNPCASLCTVLSGYLQHYHINKDDVC
ncbi:hypothetical protein COV17_00210 [Candidatus Woesearchaeota archaeon CG10_big_fil_rev_8_21_14_0_10_36_11]|nr:MAG: hypothetical protein COV17_00210 [Candidatus Woesearchaeota archaeon CG10_big_fil_rev_8_21_14_0_10_36_11]